MQFFNQILQLHLSSAQVQALRTDPGSQYLNFNFSHSSCALPSMTECTLTETGLVLSSQACVKLKTRFERLTLTNPRWYPGCPLNRCLWLDRCHSWGTEFFIIAIILRKVFYLLSWVVKYKKMCVRRCNILFVCFFGKSVLIKRECMLEKFDEVGEMDMRHRLGNYRLYTVPRDHL